jgi:hypothetical protein
MAAVSSALRTLGYEQAQAISTGEFVSHQVAFERTDGHGLQHVIDLHWKAVNPQLLADALPFPVLWREAEAIATLGQHARVPCRLDAVLLACVHRMAHHQGQERLIWLYDLKLLTAPFGQDEWHAMCRMAADRRVAGLCLDGLQGMSSRLGGRVPDAVAKALTRAATTEPSRRYLEGAVRRRDVLVSDLVLLPNWRARLKLVREHAFPPVPFIRQRYGIRNPFLLPALYLHRLATGAWKWLLQPR